MTPIRSHSDHRARCCRRRSRRSRSCKACPPIHSQSVHAAPAPGPTPPQGRGGCTRRRQHGQPPPDQLHRCDRRLGAGGRSRLGCVRLLASIRAKFLLVSLCLRLIGRAGRPPPRRVIPRDTRLATRRRHGSGVLPLSQRRRARREDAARCPPARSSLPRYRAPLPPGRRRRAAQRARGRRALEDCQCGRCSARGPRESRAAHDRRRERDPPRRATARWPAR